MKKMTGLMPLVAAAAIVGSAVAAEARDLKFSLLLPENHVLVENVFKPFKQEVEEASGGDLTVTLYPSAVLGDSKEQLRLTETGVADLALIVPSYTRGRFPLLETGSLPFAFDSAAHGTRVLQALRDDYIEPEFDSVKLLYAAMTSPTALLTVSKQLGSLEDIDGITLRGTGGEQNNVLEDLGANLVNVPATDLYVAMERGTIEGTILSLASAPGYKLEEIVKYVNRVNFSSTPIAVVMNQGTWNSLSEEDQAIISEASQNAAVNTGDAYDDADEQGLETLTSNGAEVVNFSDEDVAKLRKVTEPTWDNWQSELAGDRADAEAFMGDFRAAIDSQK